MTLKDIKETKRYGRTDRWTDRQRENSIPTHKHSLRGNTVCGGGGIKNNFSENSCQIIKGYISLFLFSVLKRSIEKKTF